MKKKEFVIYTDGSCIKNPGPGGWACIVHGCGNRKPELFSGYAEHTTNCAMELKAAVEALKRIPPQSKATVFSDSKYVVNGASEWIFDWIQNDWKTTRGKKVKNVTLWVNLLSELKKHVGITFKWVKAHNGNKGNELCNTAALTVARAVHERQLKNEQKSNVQ